MKSTHLCLCKQSSSAAEAGPLLHLLVHYHHLLVSGIKQLLHIAIRVQEMHLKVNGAVTK